MTSALQSLEQNVPPTAREQLAAIARFHNDRDEAPLEFFWRYPMGRGLPSQQASYEKAVAEMTARVGTMGDAEKDALWCAYGEYLGPGYLQPNVGDALASRPLQERVAHALARTYVAHCTYDLRPYLKPGVPSDSRVVATIPDLRERFSQRDALLMFDGSSALRDSWVEHGEHQLQVHPCLRRGFSGRPNAALLATLRKLTGLGCKVGLAIDHYRLSPTGTLRTVVELDRWFGATYTRNDLDDTTRVGPILHGRSQDLGPLWHQKAGWLTEFWWACDEAMKSLEVSELPLPVGDDSDRPVLARFLHAIRDTASRRFTHIDGAIHVYSAPTYAERYAQSTNHHLSRVWADEKLKLFRVDATDSVGIGAEDWANLMTTFFSGNEMVLEYLSGQSFAEIYRAQYGHDHPWIASNTRADEENAS